MRNLISTGLLTIALNSSLLALEDKQLLALAQEAYTARADAGGLTNRDAAVEAFREPFEGVDDAMRTRALVLSLYSIDETDSKWSMSASVPMGILYALADDPEFIRDWSAYRKMLKNETNPRKFFLLSAIAPSVNADTDKQHDFVAERIHMLFADGRVAKEEGEYTRPYAHDVSQYAYTAIVGNLRLLGADFEPPAKNLPHEEQAVILAKWLKENWPGCEDIEIPRRLLGETSKARMALVENQPPSPSRIKKREQKTLQDAIPQNEESRLPWIIAGVLLLGILALLLKAFKGKSTS